MLTLLVPQGAEYQAVCRGLKSCKNPPQVVALPIGVEPVTQFLIHWQRSPSFTEVLQSGVLVMGLCGSLTAKLRVGDRVLYQFCQNASGKVLECDPTLTAQIQQHLTETTLVRAFTSDRIISSAHEKQQLGQIHQADVVDMEGSAIMTILAQAGVAVAMARVVSDDIDHDLPDLSAAISPEGKLRSLPLALGMIRQPIAALRLIRGSLKGLRTLEAISARLP
ncbi:MAG: phosphorylase [Phormidesmis sp. CAN_BIN44]|nr:phosphorylase [Phormidesmis sp. CAN_BIN44]